MFIYIFTTHSLNLQKACSNTCKMYHLQTKIQWEVSEPLKRSNRLCYVTCKQYLRCWTEKKPRFIFIVWTIISNSMLYYDENGMHLRYIVPLKKTTHLGNYMYIKLFIWWSCTQKCVSAITCLFSEITFWW